MATSPLPRGRRWTYGALTAVLLLTAIELIGKAAGMAIDGSRFSRTRLQAHRDALAASAGRASVGANVRWSRDERSSLQLARLVEANGARYYHFLQPSQYVPGSKPMSAAERAIAIAEGHPYRGAVEAGYPLLRRAGAALAADGVRFTDLTAAFAGHPEAIYFDACCHVNARGNAILAELMFEAIRRHGSPAAPR